MKFTIVTGLSGAGKTIALNCLEDMGYYCIDNLPPALIGSFIELAEKTDLDVNKIALCIDMRAGELIKDLGAKLKYLKNKNIDYRIIYLDASNEVLIRRYKETRRNHPLSQANIQEGIIKERELLKDVRAHADYIFDTSKTKTSNFSQAFRAMLEDSDANPFIINVFSFGFKYGAPADADLVYDMRFIPNPYYIPSLKELTGNSKKVSEFVLKHDVTQEFLKRTVDLLEIMIPHYMQEGKFSLNIACGCTGGHHRSVAVANELARRLKEKHENVSVEHRDL